jgi:hypothetical protein
LEIHVLPDPYLFEYYSVVLLLALLFAGSFFVGILKPLQRFSAILLLIIPALYFYLIIDEHILNVPYIDDYDLLESIHNLTRESSFLDKIKVLFSQINQHRFAYERVVMWLILVITGSENIKLQIIIGNAFLLGILYLFFRVLKKESISWYFLIPVNFFLFNLVYYENANWGIAAIQNTSLLFFAFLCAYSLGSTEKKSWYVAIAAALLATFTSGSGLLTWIIGFVILLFQKKFKSLGIWITLSLAVFFFYFLFDYHVIPSSGQSFLKHPLYNLSFLLAFWGNALYLEKPHPTLSGNYYDIAACVALGAAIGLVFLSWLLRWFQKKQSDKTDYFLLGSMMFAMGTGAMLVMSRPIDFYVTYGGELFSRRYMIFGVTLLIAAYCGLVILTKKYRNAGNFILVSAMVFAIGLNFTSYFMSLPYLRKQYEQLSLDRFYWNKYTMLLSFGDYFGDKLFWNHPTRMKNLVSDLASTGIYTFPAENFPAEAKNRSGDSTRRTEGKFEKFSETKNNWLGKPSRNIHLTYFGSENSQFTAGYFQLRSKKHLFVLPALPIANTLQNFIFQRKYYSNEFRYAFFANKFLPGTYQVWVVGRETADPKSRWKSGFTGTTITL